MIRQSRQHDPDHLAFVRMLPCCVCGDDTSTEACHVRYADPIIAKPNPGLQAKPDDKYTVPLCGAHHRKQHEGSETQWWLKLGIDPVKVSLAIYSVSGEYEKARAIVAACSQRCAA